MPRPAPIASVLSSLLAAPALVLGLAGCAGEVPMTPAENANDPACADVIVRLPQTLAGLEKRTTNAQSTGAWGDPVGVQLICGETPSGPTTDDCVSVNDVDWIIDRSQAPLYRFEAYGRTPGLAAERASGTDAVASLGSIAKVLPQERACTSLIDTLDLD
ncbi:DUF3515 family protein [Leucobacter soli]|uniref:DUF3515 family protein n=1 Tax=Leucobacter soli TaxID=2812850 RepID=UPI0036143F92